MLAAFGLGNQPIIVIFFAGHQFTVITQPHGPLAFGLLVFVGETQPLFFEFDFALDALFPAYRHPRGILVDLQSIGDQAYAPAQSDKDRPGKTATGDGPDCPQHRIDRNEGHQVTNEGIPLLQPLLNTSAYLCLNRVIFLCALGSGLYVLLSSMTSIMAGASPCTSIIFHWSIPPEIGYQ